jgi:antitoxin component of MazEF toxin-antitoxin module
MKTNIITKWGNSRAIRLPRELADSLHMYDNTRVVLHKKPEGILITLAPTNTKHAVSDFSNFIIPTGRRTQENISQNIDALLYEKSDR